MRWLPIAAVLLALPARALTIDWVYVGHPGNPPDTEVMNDGTTGYGSVAYGYYVSKYELMNFEYAEFLNAVAVTDPNRLYHLSMGTSRFGGIQRSGADGSYAYEAIPGRELWPVTFVDFEDALRFANWMHNGQPSGAQTAATTEDGAYTITAAGHAANSITRNPWATVFLTSEDEWYKAAYYDPVSRTYFDYPTGTDVAPGCVLVFPGADSGNQANCFPASFPTGLLLRAGSYSSSGSPSGTFDQGGNVWEWNESIVGGFETFPNRRAVRGGGWSNDSDSLAASTRWNRDTGVANEGLGFRVASIPEPSTALLLAMGLLALAARPAARAPLGRPRSRWCPGLESNQHGLAATRS